MAELWSIPLVRISAAVGAAAAAMALLTPLWDRYLQTAGRRRVWCLLVLALLVGPWLHLPVPAGLAAAGPQVPEELPVAVQALPEAAPADSLQTQAPVTAGVEASGGTQTVQAPVSRVSPEAVAMGVYLAGAAVFCLYEITGHLLFCRRIRRWARPAEDPVLLEQYRALTARDRRPPRLLVLPGLASPMLAGLLRPVLLVPRESGQPRMVQWVLRHELTHWRRRDLMWKALALAANALHWFNPLVWLLRRRLDLDLEQSCDESVLENADAADRRSYGAVILSAASNGRCPSVSTSLRGGARALRQRLGRILDRPRKRGRGWSVLCGVLCLALVLSACARETVPAEQEGLAAGDAAAPEAAGARKSEDFYTFLITGQTEADANTDTILLAAYDVTNQKLTVVNIPRETMVNVPWDVKTIGSVYQYYGGGEEGMACLRETVTALLGFAPDYTIQVDWDAVGKIVDAMGGVWFDVPLDMSYDDPYQNLHIRQEAGYRLLTGADAMQVLRYRMDNDPGAGYPRGPLDRIATQQAFLAAMAEQLLETDSLPQLTELAQVVKDSVKTDLSLSNLLWLLGKGVGLSREDIRFVTLPGESAAVWSDTYQVHLSYALPQQEALVDLVNEDLNPYDETLTAGDLAIMSVDSQGALHCSSGPVADAAAAGAVS